MRDSITALGRMLSRELALADSLRNVSRAPVAAADSAVAPPKNVGNDGKDRKAMTKMLESMTAENVVKLLHGMSDEEVKGLLLSLKTKQAAKILAALDPDRAAKLIR
jgi:flagellar motility protein MotE (MotC chaperone)